VRGLFIIMHEPRVASHVGGQYRRQPALDPDWPLLQPRVFWCSLLPITVAFASRRKATRIKGQKSLGYTSRCASVGASDRRSGERRHFPGAYDRCLSRLEWSAGPKITNCRRSSGNPWYGRRRMRELNIDAKHSQAIWREIGERLRGLLRDQPDVPTRLRELVRQFGEDGYSALRRQDLSTRLSARIARLRGGLDHRNRR